MNIEQIRAIEDQKDKLVKKVEDFLDNRSGGLEDKVPVKPSQLQNILGLSIATTSVREIVNFIQYQIGREDPQKPDKYAWRKDSFGTELIQNIWQVAQKGDDNEVNIRLVRLFIGYLMRYARYRSP